MAQLSSLSGVEAPRCGMATHALHAQHGVVPGSRWRRPQTLSAFQRLPAARRCRPDSPRAKLRIAHAVLHLCEGCPAPIMPLVSLVSGQMEGNVVALGVDLVQAQGAVHRTGQVPGVFHGQEGIIAVHIHSQCGGGVGHQAFRWLPGLQPPAFFPEFQDRQRRPFLFR